MIASGQFREDLYYRLAEIVIRIPALAERHGDITLLSAAFRPAVRRRAQPQCARTVADALGVLNDWPWPGNVRELENRMKRAVIMCDGKLVTAADLDLGKRPDMIEFINLKAAREAADRKAIRQALARTENNISNAAKLLGHQPPDDLRPDEAIRPAAISD